MRRSIDGLAKAVRERFDAEPEDAQALYVFWNRRRDRLKLLWCDQTGWYLLYKRLRNRTVVPPLDGPAGASSVIIDKRALASLLDGVQNVRRGLTRRQVARRARKKVTPTTPNSSTAR